MDGGKRKNHHLCGRQRKSGTLKILYVQTLKFKGGNFEIDLETQSSSEKPPRSDLAPYLLP